jgi:hypothetical protein
MQQTSAGTPGDNALIFATPTGACPISTCIYVVNGFDRTVLVYPANATGNVKPYRTITMKTPFLPSGIALDRRGRTFVSLPSEIRVYAALANGDAKPLLVIKGPKTHLSGPNPNDIALDAGGDVYAVNYHTGRRLFSDVTVYAKGARGNSSPIRRIIGPATEMHPAGGGIALDSLGNTYVTIDPAGHYGPRGGKAILVYAAGATGNVAPIWEIYGSKTTLAEPFRIAVDKGSNVYVTDEGGSSGGGAVKVYAAGAYGNVAPIRTISGSKTGLSIPYGITVDAKNRIYVVNSVTSSVTVYAAGANGDAAPIQTITGSKTGLDHPIAIGIR